MAHDDLEKPLQPLPPMLDHVVAEPIRKDLARQRRDGDARALALQDVAEILEVRVAAPHAAVLQLEGRDVGPADDLVVGVHGARGAVRLRVADLVGVRGGGFSGLVWRWMGRGEGMGKAYFDLEEVLGWAVDFFEALLAGVGHGLHLGGGGWVVGWKFATMMRILGVTLVQ